jgi:hypothetical protein
MILSGCLAKSASRVRQVGRVKGSGRVLVVVKDPCAGGVCRACFATACCFGDIFFGDWSGWNLSFPTRARRRVIALSWFTRSGVLVVMLVMMMV